MYEIDSTALSWCRSCLYSAPVTQAGFRRVGLVVSNRNYRPLGLAVRAPPAQRPPRNRGYYAWQAHETAVLEFILDWEFPDNDTAVTHLLTVIRREQHTPARLALFQYLIKKNLTDLSQPHRLVLNSYSSLPSPLTASRVRKIP